MYEDDDEDKDGILKMLGGEVDDYAGSQLKDPNEKQGVTIEISVKPHGQPGMDEDKEKVDMEAGNEEHDPIAHVLGMCRGGCPE